MINREQNLCNQSNVDRIAVASTWLRVRFWRGNCLIKQNNNNNNNNKACFGHCQTLIVIISIWKHPKYFISNQPAVIKQPWSASLLNVVYCLFAVFLLKGTGSGNSHHFCICCGTHCMSALLLALCIDDSHAKLFDIYVRKLRRHTFPWILNVSLVLRMFYEPVSWHADILWSSIQYVTYGDTGVCIF